MAAVGLGVAGAITLPSSDVENRVGACCRSGLERVVFGVLEELGDWYCRGRMVDEPMLPAAMVAAERMAGAGR